MSEKVIMQDAYNWNLDRIFKLINQSNPNIAYLWVGSLLTGMFLLQWFFQLQWSWLSNLQHDEVYRQFTGYLLLVYVAMQARLGIKRTRNRATNLRREFDTHKIQGALGPLVFYFHSMEIGYAYQMVLTVVFLGNCLIGYLSPQIVSWRHKFYISIWTIVHVSLAIITIVLMLFHIVIVYQYS